MPFGHWIRLVFTTGSHVVRLSRRVYLPAVPGFAVNGKESVSRHTTLLKLLEEMSDGNREILNMPAHARYRRHDRGRQCEACRR